MRYAELRCRTHYSFLRGASSPAELIGRASELGLEAVAITDRDGVYGIPKAFLAAKETGFRLITGAELTLAERPRLTLLACDRAGYGLMCRMLSASHEGKSKGNAALEDVRFREFMGSSTYERGRKGLIVLAEEGLVSRQELLELRVFFSGRFYLTVSRTLDDRDHRRSGRVMALGRDLDIPVVATNEVHFHRPERRKLQDTLTSIRKNMSLSDAGMSLSFNGEHYLKSPKQMAILFEDFPEAIWNTVRVAEQCLFSPSELRYRYPSEWIPAGETAQSYLVQLTWKGAHKRYKGHPPSDVVTQLEHELKVIDELGFADYFLTIWEIVSFARSRKILCQGRGSAANSIVCFCLEITAVDPVKMSLLFERFISAERGEPPDIDVDFEHERREEVIQHIYTKYGRDRAGMVAAVITYRSRSAIRDVSKALGISEDELRRHPHALKICEEIQDFPRHLSIHSGGFTLSAEPIIETVPIEPARMPGRTIVQWDKNDLAAIGLLKVDILALGMLSALRKSLDEVGLEIYSIPDDEETYRMIRRGDTVGVFQIESRAQMGMLKRLLPQTFYDLVIEVAIVRPGPIVGEMVHPYLRRRRGQESSKSPDPRLEPILGRTLGVPLFQEQVMKMAVDLAGFTPGQADELRRAIGAWRSSGQIDRLGRKLMKGLLDSGLPREFVERVFKQVQGFAEYGFPESHAASFALLAYVSAYLKCHYPAQFTWALLNSQPMGFYSNHTLIDEAKRQGVRVLPVDVNVSVWDCSLEEGALRIGFRTVNGMSKAKAHALIIERSSERGRFKSLADFVYRSRLDSRVLECLAAGDAFSIFGFSQRTALWDLLKHKPIREQGQLDFFSEMPTNEAVAHFKPLSESQAIHAEYRSYGLSTRGHPMKALREELGFRLPSLTSLGIKQGPNGRMASVAGLVIARQRPPTAKGTAFATLEDEDGFVDLVIHKGVFQHYEEVFTESRFLVVTGQVQADGAAVSLIVKRMETLEAAVLRGKSRDFH